MAIPTGKLADRTRAGYAAFNAGDVETLVAMLDPGFEWHEAVEIPGVKSATNRDEFVHFMRGFDRLWEEFGFEPEELRPAADEALIYARVRARGRGKASADEVEFVIHHVWRLRDGLFARMDAYLEQDEALAAAGLSA